MMKDSERCELEANWFAIGFLMPEVEFRRAFAKHGNIFRVANDFGVSSHHAHARAVALGLIKESKP